jgi:ELWxxDGT repeat protein
MGTRLYFEATDGSSGYELWAHETTNDSTWQVADIYSGGSGQANDIVVMGTRLYFGAWDGSSGYELWAHETTNDSTWQVADINSGANNGGPNGMTVMGTRLYFEARDNSNIGYELHMMEIEHTITYN